MQALQTAPIQASPTTSTTLVNPFGPALAAETAAESAGGTAASTGTPFLGDFAALLAPMAGGPSTGSMTPRPETAIPELVAPSVVLPTALLMIPEPCCVVSDGSASDSEQSLLAQLEGWSAIPAPVDPGTVADIDDAMMADVLAAWAPIQPVSLNLLAVTSTSANRPDDQLTWANYIATHNSAVTGGLAAAPVLALSTNAVQPAPQLDQSALQTAAATTDDTATVIPSSLMPVTQPSLVAPADLAAVPQIAAAQPKAPALVPAAAERSRAPAADDVTQAASPMQSLVASASIPAVTRSTSAAAKERPASVETTAPSATTDIAQIQALDTPNAVTPMSMPPAQTPPVLTETPDARPPGAAVPVVAAAPTTTPAAVPIESARPAPARRTADESSVPSAATSSSAAAAAPSLSTPSIVPVTAKAEVPPSLRSEANPVERAVAHQVARTIVQHLPDGGTRMVMRLTPPELGTVRVEFITRDGMMTARLMAEDEGVRQALDRALPHIRAEVRGDHPSLDITVDRGEQRQAWSDGQSRQDQRNEQQAAKREQRDDDQSAFSIDGVTAAPTPTPIRAEVMLGGRATAAGVDVLA